GWPPPRCRGRASGASPCVKLTPAAYDPDRRRMVGDADVVGVTKRDVHAGIAGPVATVPGRRARSTVGPLPTDPEAAGARPATTPGARSRGHRRSGAADGDQGAGPPGHVPARGSGRAAGLPAHRPDEYVARRTAALQADTRPHRRRGTRRESLAFADTGAERAFRAGTGSL